MKCSPNRKYIKGVQTNNYVYNMSRVTWWDSDTIGSQMDVVDAVLDIGKSLLVEKNNSYLSQDVLF